MKRIWMVTLAVVVLAAVPGFAQQPDTSFNVNEITAPEIPDPPVIDGDLSDGVWANVPEFEVMMDGDAPAPTEEGDLDVVAKVAWHDETNAVYFGIRVVDDVFINLVGLGSYDSNGWNNERVEVIIDGINSGEAGDLTASGYHQQYTFDMANTLDPLDPENGLYGMMDIPVSTSFARVPVYERISAAVEPDNDVGYPYNLSDDFMESAAQIRATEEGLSEWVEAPVEFVWEIKLVIFEELLPNSVIGMDFTDPANIANDYQDYFADPDQRVKDLAANQAIGFTIQQNDADEYADIPPRQHQNNTTGFSGNWNSSENLSALILSAPVTPVEDWSIK